LLGNRFINYVYSNGRTEEWCFMAADAELCLLSAQHQEKHMSSTWLATPHRGKIGIAEQQLLEESIL
jgi:hypothetical protein